jgi:hypothetical protein
MKKRRLTISITLLIVIFGVLFIWIFATSTETKQGIQSSMSSTSDGTITFTYSPTKFGLATNPAQILPKSYIPACDENFNYCLYYVGNEYIGTNFESAGVRISKRADLPDEQSCLTTPPAGYEYGAISSSTKSADTYSTTVFGGLSDAATGHYSLGSEYRLFVKSNSSCYEFETRIGQSRFENYPAGTIKEFTGADLTKVQADLMDIIHHITLSSDINKSVF